MNKGKREQNKGTELSKVNMEAGEEIIVERKIFNRADLPARLFGYVGGIDGGNVPGLMTKTHKNDQ
ncbi:hypothetical protein [Anaerosolibacter sp.]|uniref:hypothetical protein n=1 Tax=Anaerosolibacter sp. TaxID=1872527 RepID=UPI0039EEC74F